MIGGAGGSRWDAAANDLLMRATHTLAAHALNKIGRQAGRQAGGQEGRKRQNSWLPNISQNPLPPFAGKKSVKKFADWSYKGIFPREVLNKKGPFS